MLNVAYFFISICMNFFQIINESLKSELAKKAVSDIEMTVLLNRKKHPNIRKDGFVKEVQRAVLQICDKYERDVFVLASIILQNKYNKNFGSFSYLTKKGKSNIFENLENNPYLTPSQKYEKKHKNQNAHHHSINRTMGNDTNRKSKKMVPKVRRELKNPYKNKSVNKSQNTERVLTPLEMQTIEHDYGIDFNDRRIKTIKGKTNMILTPLKNGGWKIGHL